jgi:hypothetical protein
MCQNIMLTSNILCSLRSLGLKKDNLDIIIDGLITTALCYISSTEGATLESSIQINLTSEHITISIMVLSLGFNYTIILHTEFGS